MAEHGVKPEEGRAGNVGGVLEEWSHLERNGRGWRNKGWSLGGVCGLFFPCCESMERGDHCPWSCQQTSQLSKSVRCWEDGSEVRHVTACAVGVSQRRLGGCVSFTGAPKGLHQHTVLESSTIWAEVFPLDQVVGVIKECILLLNMLFVM